MQSLTLVFTLLRDKPEQEQNLLRLLVNKLVRRVLLFIFASATESDLPVPQGDTEKSVCSRASYYLLQLLQTHPSMKAVVVREITALVLRPLAPPSTAVPVTSNSSKHIRFAADSKAKSTSKTTDANSTKKNGRNAHARYYATITLNQVVLTSGDREIALQLMHVYFEMFKELLGEGRGEEKGDIEDTGDTIAKEKEGRELRVDNRGRVVDHRKDKGKGKMAETKGAAGFAEIEDTYSKLVSAILTGVNRAVPFAKIDSGDTR